MAPRIFTFLRSPGTGTSGGWPTRLQVACKVESWRKLASSVKIKAQFCAWAFFNLWIGASMPSVLRGGVGPRQYAPGPLHREAERVKQLAHMSRMVGDAELLLDHPGNHRRGPYAVVQSVSHRTAVQNVAQLLALLLCQL